MTERRKLGASPPGSLPSLARTRRPWLLDPARGRLPPPRVGSARSKRAPRASPSSWGGCQGPGTGGARGQETVTPESSISRTPAWLPRWAPEILRRQGSAESALPHPSHRLASKPPGPLPETPPFKVRWRRARVPLTGECPPPRRSARTVLRVPLRGEQRCTPRSALPGPRAPTLQQVEPLGWQQRWRLHPVLRLPAARSRPQH